MSSYSGVFRYLDERGAETAQGPCRVSVQAPNLFVTPENGPSLSIDLGDIDRLDAREYELSVRLYTGKTLLLTRFAKVFENLRAELLKSYRDRLVQCFLLEDLEEIERFDAHVDVETEGRGFSSPAQLRLYKSNLAILPERGPAQQWRLAEIDEVKFDDAVYRTHLRSRLGRIEVTKLAKRTDEFIERLKVAMSEISRITSGTVSSLCPFLSPDQLLEASRLLKEGRVGAFSRLNRIDPGIEQSIVTNVVTPSLKPYFQALTARATESDWFGGFKIIRPEEDTGEIESTDDEGLSPEASESEANKPVEADGSDGGIDRDVLFWFFFPLKTGTTENGSDLIAWESTSHSGRATYFFRSGAISCSNKTDVAGTDLESEVRRLNDALLLLNFRREPIYLPDTSLHTDNRYRRYAIACRRIESLKGLRASYVGRAIHSSLEAWQKQVDRIIGRG